MGFVKYIKETKAEMKHVSWPTKKQAMIYTVLVIAISLIVAVYVGLFDWFFTKVIDTFLVQSNNVEAPVSTSTPESNATSSLDFNASVTGTDSEGNVIEIPTSEVKFINPNDSTE